MSVRELQAQVIRGELTAGEAIKCLAGELLKQWADRPDEVFYPNKHDNALMNARDMLKLEDKQIKL